MKDLKIILIAGEKGAGKDEAACVMSREIPGAVVMSFADPMKNILCKTLGITRAEFEVMKRQNHQIQIGRRNVNSVRALIQNFGNEAMKPEFGPSVWASLFIQKMPKQGVIIVPDFRFYIELYSILSHCGKENVYTVRVIDNDLDNQDSHASEVEIADFETDSTIDNTGHTEVGIESMRKLGKYLYDRI